MEKDKLKELLSNLKKGDSPIETPDIREWIAGCCKDWVEGNDDNRACLCILGERENQDDGGTSVVFLKAPKNFISTCIYNFFEQNKEFCEEVYMIAKSVLEEDKKPDIIVNSSSKKVVS